MRRIVAAVGLALCASGAPAADFGLGVSVRSDDGALYAPIDISKSFRLEPSVRYASSEQTNDVTSGTEIKQLEVGIGVFGLAQVTESARLYYGVRLAYLDQQIDSFYFGNSGRTTVEDGQDGYSVGPTLGFEYLIGKHFSVGGEASYAFVDLEGERVATTRSLFGQVFQSRNDLSDESSGTQTRLIFRYMF
jgi:hypothetical protein